MNRSYYRHLHVYHRNEEFYITFKNEYQTCLIVQYLGELIVSRRLTNPLIILHAGDTESSTIFFIDIKNFFLRYLVVA